jgi:hypothetical protein
MYKITNTVLVICCLMGVIPVSGQAPVRTLNQVHTIEQARQFIRSYPELQGRIFEITSDKDTSDITLPLFDRKPGFTFDIGKDTYRLIDTTSYPEFRVSYIFLDGNQLSMQVIDSIRQEIIRQFNSGTYFFDLVKIYTMDGNPNGDLEWFRENMMMKEFETGVKQHHKNDIFTVDIPEKKWFYVVFKTFDDRQVRQLTFLKTRRHE